ncbi:hypothetical protein [Streptomyces sp. V1I1]|uniref:hypothetical protein n=1 Tax=Streptomyces sp. V1I1 TaxID=3042272 RepID=UPI00277FBA9C|nr:hypothetical protein [Streptomyces sp. V1I1]MDQ0939115.1 MFS family permease [Streptomyces sp. V1I1]
MALLLFVAAVAVPAPAVVETVNTIAPHARGAAVALYACSMFIGVSLGPQLTGALAGQGFGGILRIVAVALVLGIDPALPACATSPPNHPAIPTHPDPAPERSRREVSDHLGSAWTPSGASAWSAGH